jgi:predicted phage gp36 major capsid-like protein
VPLRWDDHQFAAIIIPGQSGTYRHLRDRVTGLLAESGLNNNVLQNMKGIVDAFGRPYYPNLRDASPTLEGFPVVIDHNIPNLTASTASGAIFGRVRDAMVIRRVTNEASILRLTERYADFLQVGFLGFERYDIRSNDLRAAVVAKPAASWPMEYRDVFRRYLRTGDDTEIRAAGVGTGSAGGFLFPQEFRGEFVAQLKAYATLLADFTEVPTDNGRDLIVPGRQVVASGSQVSENPGSAISDVDVTFTGQMLKAFMFPSGVHKVPLSLALDASVIPVESVISDAAGEVIGRALSTASVSGTGTGQPQGVYTAANAQGAWSAGGLGGFVALGAAQAVEVDGAASTELGSNVPAPQTLRKMVRAVDPHCPKVFGLMTLSVWFLADGNELAAGW